METNQSQQWMGWSLQETSRAPIATLENCILTTVSETIIMRIVRTQSLRLRARGLLLILQQIPNDRYAARTLIRGRAAERARSEAPSAEIRGTVIIPIASKRGRPAPPRCVRPPSTSDCARRLRPRTCKNVQPPQGPRTSLERARPLDAIALHSRQIADTGPSTSISRILRCLRHPL